MYDANRYALKQQKKGKTSRLLKRATAEAQRHIAQLNRERIVERLEIQRIPLTIEPPARILESDLLLPRKENVVQRRGIVGDLDVDGGC